MKRRKRYNKKYPSTKIVGATGKLQYLSQIKKQQRRAKAYKNPDASFWADYTPRRDTGVFANIHGSTYTHNGVTKYL